MRIDRFRVDQGRELSLGSSALSSKHSLATMSVPNECPFCALKWGSHPDLRPYYEDQRCPRCVSLFVIEGVAGARGSHGAQMVKPGFVQQFLQLQNDNAALKATVTRLEKTLETLTERMFTLEVRVALEDARSDVEHKN